MSSVETSYVFLLLFFFTFETMVTIDFPLYLHVMELHPSVKLQSGYLNKKTSHEPGLILWFVLNV